MSLGNEFGHETPDVLAMSDGTVISVRVVSPADAPALQRLHGRLSERSVELRFFAPLGELSDAKAERLARAQDAEHFAFAALDPDGHEEFIAVVRYEREAGGQRAEYAAVVEDSWQGRGLGLVMTNRLIETARVGGVQCLYSLVSPGNERMLRLLRGLGLPTRVGRESGAECIEVDLLGDGVTE
jgi:RimJ/RimL family protein N-acetyltransferase